MELFEKKSLNIDDLQVWKKDALEKFEAKMVDKEQRFPCIPATQGHSLNHLRYGFVGDPREVSSAEELANLLSAYTPQSKNYGKYTSLIIFYETPADLSKTSVEEFEQMFWKQLSWASEFDSIEWPENIPVDPHDSAWEFCFQGEKYFMYCATPAHQNRQSRYFPYFMLAITPRWVLEKFNSSPSLAQKIKSNIRERITHYDSISIHPDLNSYGEEDNFEWKQYYLHDDDSALSKCPFHRMLNTMKREE